MPRNQVLRENYDAMTASPNPKSKQNTPNAAHRRFPSKENAPPPPAIDPNSPAVKTKSPLPPRPPLKRKLSAESGASDNCSVMANSVDSGVKVVVRVRPPNGEEEDGGNALQKITEDSLTISGQTFTFDSVVDIQSKQIDIFELVGAPLVENCLSGFNGSVFAYGQTGSGKTYTIWGASNALLDEDHQGLAPRVFRKLFERIEEEQVKQADKQLMYMCRCSFLEIYNEQITDLLDPSQKNLQIREDVRTGVYVENLTEECVSSMKDVAQLLVKGLSNRRTSATYANAESSRSHSVFTCVVESRSKRSADGLSYMKTSRINFVDLAGSERQKQTGAAGERLKEAGNINRSLSQLGNLINILAEVSQTGKQRHIPYRDSKLTFLLQESLGGNAKLAMICAISPSRSCQSETISTLRFAQRAKSIKNRAIINEEMQDDVNVLREVIRQLRDELQRVKTNNSQVNQTGAYAIGWNARRSLNLLRYSLNRPTALPHGKDDSDEEMEIVDSNEAMPSIHEGTLACSPKRVCDDADVNMEDGTFETVVTGHSSHDVSATQMASLERKSDIEPDNVSCGQSEKGETRNPIEQCSSMDLPENADTPEKNTNCSDDAMTANARVVQIDVSPVLTSPAPSVSPKLSSSRKSLRTSSTITASQCFPSQHTSEAADVPIMKPSKSICLNSLSNRRSCFASTEHLAATLHRGLEIIASQRLNPAMRRSSFRFSSMPAEVKTVIPVVKVDVGVQAVSQDDLMNQEAGDSLCIKCKNKKHMQELTNIEGEGEGEGDAQNLQLVPVSGSSLHEKCKSQVPRAVEKVLAGAIRREMALEEICSKQNSEIMQLNRLVQQYKHERECNEIIRQTREDKIARLESLMDGILPTEDFMEEELLSLTHEHKILIKKYDNHPDVTRAKLELKKAHDELEKYQNFFDLGEKDILLEEVQDLRNQLQLYLDSSAKTFRRQAPLVQLTSSVEPSVAPTLFTDPREIAEERLQQERIQWTEAESKWISLVEELKTELEENRSIAQRQKQELDMEKNCSDELKEAMHMAMEGHARMLEQYAELEERHMQLLARHRKIQYGIDDVKRAAAKAGVRGAESKFINALAAEISALKVEREKERRHFRDENKGLQAQLRDTAEAVQAANELLVRLKETEEALAAEQRRATMAEQETENAYKEMEKLSKLVTARHMPVDKFSGEECKGAASNSSNQQWQEEFAPSYGAEEEPPAWFSGYDRCNI